MAFSLHKIEIGGEQTAGQAVSYLAEPQGASEYYSEGSRAPMVWRASQEARDTLGMGDHVELWKVESLLNGRHPLTGELIRHFGPSRTLIGGIDVTLSPAPKSVSVLWAMADDDLRLELETIVVRSATGALAGMAGATPLVRQRYGPGARDVHAIKAREVVGVHVLHTTARLSETKPGTPDPQLHTHSLLFGDLTEQGKLRAIESRFILQAQTELDARATGYLAQALEERGFEIERQPIHDAKGHVKRIAWELKDVPEALNVAMSGRSQEIQDLARQFREHTGRAAEGPAWERFVTARRGPKSKLSSEELKQAWAAEGEEYGFGPQQAAQLNAAALQRRDSFRERGAESPEAEQFRQEVLAEICRVHAMVSLNRLRGLAQQRALGLISPSRAGRIVADLFGSGDLLLLENGMVTTLQVVAREQRARRALEKLLKSEPAPSAEQEALESEFQQREDEGNPFDPEQQEAIALALSGARFVSIAGPAGTGKGFASSSMVNLWHDQGRRVFALAVAGRTTQQAAHDSGAEPVTLNQLQARVEHGSLQLRSSDVLLVDEAAMVDTARYADLLEVAAAGGVTLVQIGDDHQLAPVTAGGLWTVFHRLAEEQGLATQLRTVRRARDPGEAEAWTDFREGRVHEALTWYYDQGQLRLYDRRPELLNAMVADWWARNPDGVMVVDTSNAERDSINRMAQAKRLEAGELGAEIAQLTNGREIHAGDRVLFSEAPYLLPGNQRRVENGTPGVVLEVGREQGSAAVIELQEPGGPRTVEIGPEAPLELAYARHVQKAQGMTAITGDVAVSQQTGHEQLYTMISRAQEGTRIHALRAEVEELGADVRELETIERTRLQPTPDLEMPLGPPEPESGRLRMFNEVEIGPGQVISFDEPLPLREPSGIEQGELGVVNSVHGGGLTWDFARVELVGGRQVNVYQPDQVQLAPAEITAQDVRDQVPAPQQRDPYSLSNLPLTNGAIIQAGDLVRFGEPIGAETEVGAQGHVVEVARHSDNCAYVELDGSGERVPVHAVSNVEIVQPAQTQAESAQPAQEPAQSQEPAQNQAGGEASIDEISRQTSRSTAKRAVDQLQSAPPAEPQAVETVRENQVDTNSLHEADQVQPQFEQDRRETAHAEPSEPEPTRPEPITMDPQQAQQAAQRTSEQRAEAHAQMQQQAVDHSAGRTPQQTAEPVAEPAVAQHQGAER